MPGRKVKVIDGTELKEMRNVHSTQRSNIISITLHDYPSVIHVYKFPSNLHVRNRNRMRTGNPGIVLGMKI